ncbi:phosphoribosylglycinamide formyltransferase [Marine Group I thaumarchaeote]|uniref:phosphoribosylglycinamide formyltransferase 1 n=1 Tax=Marine Group I thaumarchaeote TaxID=2511932 RepID=A0A7K4M7Y5_9ARCH|nr:MAG: phosphoribosylglycinamide formyltransferase [Nitrosopumilus sp. YT1]NMI81950.1 phosphoribosylglycinamide formyltransferase [Candidatus Nitrosopumilus sp. MTA1]NWJ20164.1 phosphoribosylglycinamide formyltransferase [Marine Group I thaumarchaeote]NWJ57075.1 phosphoribosylglycinamide formyltransferase [Marine Group I thaumarchaeote]NWJ84558.1 phosphoribosylglycinamide formyltransferase [Marine Group I thaumarchaeote]
MLNLGILISGRGSNMESILKSIKRKKIPINLAVVISNKSNAKGLNIAEKLGINIEIIESKGFKGNRWEYDKKVIAALTKHGVTPRNGLVCLAGFIRIISPQFVKKYKNRMINIHPALLPAFPGLDSQKQALDHGAKYSGCTVHFVDSGTDTGPIIIQAVVKVMEKDSVESLSKRILKEEHKIYPEAVNLFARKKIRVSGRRTIIS